jgi:hypothetical protein
MMHAHVRDGTAPDVSGAHHRQARHQVRGARVCRGTGRRPWAAPWALPLQRHLVHEARHVRALDLEVVAWHGGDPPLARRGPFPRETRKGGFPHRLLAAPQPLGSTAAGVSPHTADWASRLQVTAQLHDLALGLDRWGKRLVALFRLACSHVQRPSRRSTSAIRVPSSRLRRADAAKTEAAGGRKVVRPSASPEAALWGSRPNAVRLFAPDNSSSTAWALNAAVT